MKLSPQARAARVEDRLSKRYPSPKTELHWHNPWELLVATILSAQCTDARVNMVTPHLFERWASVADLSAATLPEIEEVIRSTGFYHNKAKHIQAAARMICERHNGNVPKTMQELLTLPGVARKTANVVLSNAFGVFEGIAVDTHVKRISFRLGLTASTNPAVIERDLMQLFPRRRWGDINHFLVLFGREVCSARKPNCAQCELTDICPKLGISST